jgi:hypothetical protein
VIELTLAIAGVSFHLHSRVFSCSSANKPQQSGRYISRAAEKRVKTL